MQILTIKYASDGAELLAPYLLCASSRGSLM